MNHRRRDLSCTMSTLEGLLEQTLQMNVAFCANEPFKMELVFWTKSANCTNCSSSLARARNIPADTSLEIDNFNLDIYL